MRGNGALTRGNGFLEWQRPALLPRHRALMALEADAERWRARVLYDGTEFRGMQVQNHVHQSHRTVSGELEAALLRRLLVPVQVWPSSRTDAGVHSRGQAIHFDIPRGVHSCSAAELQLGLNSMLPPDVRLACLEPAPERDAEGRPWHARYWSSGKLYTYRAQSGPDPLDPNARWARHRVPGARALDLPGMRAAAAHLVGELDCLALANRPENAGKERRRLERQPAEAARRAALLSPTGATRRVRAVEVVDEGGGALRVEFHVQAAMYKMVRNMMGLLLAVGSGHLLPAELPALLASRDRPHLPAPAPAHGLTLEAVYYETGWAGEFDHPLHRADHG